MRVVVVTGASAGVGRATAEAFATRGDAVALLAREPEQLGRALDEIEATGGKGVAIPVDVADADEVEGAAARVESRARAVRVSGRLARSAGAAAAAGALVGAAALGRRSGT